LQYRRPPLLVGGLESAWEEALNDERELFTCFPQFSPKLGHAVAAACLTIHGATGRSRFGELSSSLSLEECENDRKLARALLRGEVPLMGAADAANTPVIHNAQTSPAFLIGRLASTSRTERASFVQGLETWERDQLKKLFTNPMTLTEFWQVPASVRADLCRDARTLSVIEPTPVDHALRSLDSKELSDETLTAILQLTAASLGKGKAEVTTLRLADSLDRITALSRPLDLAALAVERFGGRYVPWLKPMAQEGAEAEVVASGPIDARRLILINVMGPQEHVCYQPVVLTERLLRASLNPPPPGKAGLPIQGSSSEMLIQSDLGAENQEAATAAAWRSLRALLAPVPTQSPPAGPISPADQILPCEGIVIWSFDPLDIRTALAKP
jgi:hypothetical protein